MRMETDGAIVVPDMKLSPNVGSDRSWVWNAAADVSEGEPEAQTLAIRFANSESKCCSCTPDIHHMLILCLQTPTASRRPSSRPSRRTRPCSRHRSKRLEAYLGWEMRDGIYACTKR